VSLNGNSVAHHPKLELLQLLFPPPLQPLHPSAIICGVRHVDYQANQVITVVDTFLQPVPFDVLRFVARRAELIDNLRTASASHSSGTSRPSLNWSGSSTSNRRHLLLIARLALYDEWVICLRQSLQSGFGNQMLPALEHAPGKAAEQEPQRLALGLAILE
jgi:hypothetical protein